jgi:DNA primase
LIPLVESCLSDNYRSYLYGRGCSDELISSYGLTQITSPTQVKHPSFQAFAQRHNIQGRLCLPIHYPVKDKLVGFEFRDIESGSKEQFIFPDYKSWVPMVFGLNQQLDRINSGVVWVVEGFFDMVALLRVVPKDQMVIATMRATLTPPVVRFLQRFASTVVLCFDQDVVGRRETDKAVRKLKEFRMKVEICSYRGGSDPSDVWENFGQEGLEEQFGMYSKFLRTF